MECEKLICDLLNEESYHVATLGSSPCPFTHPHTAPPPPNYARFTPPSANTPFLPAACHSKSSGKTRYGR